jgi:hypothetical protein
VAYFGAVGYNGASVITYFEGIPGTPKLQLKDNPATWMLGTTTLSLTHSHATYRYMI